MTRRASSRILVGTAVVLVALLAGGTLFAGSAAAQTDTTEPIVTNGEILNDSVAPGDKLVVTANATDESDLIEARVRLRATDVPYGVDDGPNGTFVLTKFDRSGLNASGVNFSTTISNSRFNGTYELLRVTFIDAAGNENSTHGYDEATSDYPRDYDSVVIDNPNAETENAEPDIQSVDLVNSRVEPGEEVAVDVSATDASDIISISAELELKSPDLDYDTEFNDRIRLEANESEVTQNGTTRLTATVPETQVDGEYRVDRVKVTDVFRNPRYSDPDTDFNADDLTVDNGVALSDTAEPTISNVYPLNSSVQPGENLTVELVLDEAGSRIVEAEATLDHQNYYGKNGEIELRQVDNTGLDRVIKLTTTVPEQTVEGEYRLDDYDIRVTDAARNTADRALYDFTYTVDIGGSNPDVSGPGINNISVANETIQAGDEVVMTADVSDASGIASVDAVFNRTRLPEAYQTPNAYDNAANSEQIASKLSFTATNESTMTTGNGTVTLRATVPSGVLSGEYKLTSVRAVDVNGAESEVGDTYPDYRYGGYLQANTDGISPLTRVSVSGDDPSTLDTTAPDIAGYEILNNTVEPGSELVVSLNATDENGLSLATVDAFPAITDSKPSVLPDRISGSATNLQSGTGFTVSATVPEDSASGVLKFGSEYNISVYDTDKNRRDISVQKLVKVGRIVSNDPQNGSYTSIQNAIDNASAGDTVEVRPGTYREELTIDKDIWLVAPDGATLNGSTLGAGTAGITIPADSTASPLMKGLTVTGYGQGIDASGTAAAWEVKNTTFTDNTGYDVDAGSTSEDWTVNDSVFADADENALNATAAERAGKANYNYWGAADGPGGDYGGAGGAVVGNVTVHPFHVSADRVQLSTPLGGESVSSLDGTNATVQFDLTNNRQTNNSYILNLSLPEGWTATDYYNDGGTRQSGESKWLWQTVTPAQTVSPSVTVAVPDGISGSYNITARALIEGSDEVLTTENSTVNVLERNLTATLAQQKIANGSETSITVEAPQSDGSFVDVTDQANYTSNNTDVATVDASGTVTALRGGNATVNVSYDGQQTNVSLFVEAASVPEAIDDNNNGEIDDIEILDAISYWQNDEAVPTTNGKTIGDFQILDLIETWRDNTGI